MTAADTCRRAVLGWLDMLEPGQRAQATYPFPDPERFAWQYTPGPRGGLSLAEMDEAQRAAAWGVADAALSVRGASEVRGIVALEPILGDIERRSGRAGSHRRDPGLYWFAVFGDPGSADGAPWSWRIGGHHIAVQATVLGERMISAAPSFLGANPATVPDGPHAGRRTIDGEERLARVLLEALTPVERTRAIVDPVAPDDIVSGNARRAALSEIPIGVTHDDLAPAGRTALDALVRHYLDRASPEVAEAAWARLRDADLGAATFAWAGPTAPGLGHYYAVRGTTFLIEYDNTQNGGNHIHSVWRDLLDDWGEDTLAAHYRAAHPTD